MSETSTATGSITFSRADREMEIDSRVEHKLIHLNEERKAYLSAFINGFLCAFVFIELVRTVINLNGEK